MSLLRLPSGAAALAFSVLFQGLSTSFAATSGDLDATFNPPAAAAQFATPFTLSGGYLYPSAPVRLADYRRLRDDGGVDTEWRIQAPLTTLMAGVTGTPWGGWIAADTLAGYWMERDGTSTRILTQGFQPSTYRVFARDDGSLVAQVNAGLARIQPDGRTDPNFSQNSRVKTLAFVKTGGGPYTLGTLWSVVAQDRQGRYFLGGTFQSIGGVERVGLVRVLPDGRPDPTWNPGPALGMAITNWADPAVLGPISAFNPIPSEFLTARPTAIAVGTNGSIVVSLDEANPQEGTGRRMAVVDAQGSVVSQFPESSPVSPRLVAVQPDGNILLAGAPLKDWNGTPVGSLIRIRPDGSLDSTFQVTLSPSSAEVWGMELDPFGRVWISGNFESVNGVARPGFARLFAYEPEASALTLESTSRRERIGAHEVLHLTAQTSGFPPPALQWYRDGVPIPGETNRGLRLAITNDIQLGEFRLVASNVSATNELDFGRVSLAVPSTKPGSATEIWAGPLQGIDGITHLVPLPNGKILFAAGQYAIEAQHPMVGRLLPDGTLDPDFGTGGVVSGDGVVENLRPLPDGGVLVAGRFTTMEGSPASGLAELDGSGRRVLRPFPVLDVPNVHAALKLSDGRYLLAGPFQTVGGQAKFRVARLKADLSLDSDFTVPMEPFQVVDALETDQQGRVLAGGAQFAFEGTLTNPPPFGMVRLLENGSPDLTFQRVTSAVRRLFVEPGGTVLAGFPLARWTSQGQLVQRFELPASASVFPTDSLQSLSPLPDGGSVFFSRQSGPLTDRVTKWTADGQYDALFEPPIPVVPDSVSHSVTAAASPGDGSILYATREFMVGRSGTFVRRILPDPDLRLEDTRLAGDQFKATLNTRPGRRYGIQSLNSLPSGTPRLILNLNGDGYRNEVQIPVTSGQEYLKLTVE